MPLNDAANWDEDYDSQDLQDKINDNNHWPLTPTVFRFLEEYARPSAGQKVLEAGCGFGKWNIILAEKYKQWDSIIGLDYSQAVKTGRQYVEENMSERLGNIHFLQGSVTELPFPDDSFDVLINLGVVGHVIEDKTVVAELFRVLKPGGVMFADVVNNTPLKWRRFFEPLGIYEKFYSPLDFSELFQSRGFLVEESFSQDFMYLLTQLLKPPEGLEKAVGLKWLVRIWQRALRLMRRLCFPVNKIADSPFGFFTCLIARKPKDSIQK